MFDFDVDTIVLDTEISNTNSVELEDKIQYKPPIEGAYFLIQKLSFEKELAYFLTEKGLPVYFAKTQKKLGYMEPELKNIFKARFLNTGISFVTTKGQELDLSLAENLYRFIRLEGGRGSQLEIILQKVN